MMQKFKTKIVLTTQKKERIKKETKPDKPTHKYIVEKTIQDVPGLEEALMPFPDVVKIILNSSIKTCSIGSINISITLNNGVKIAINRDKPELSKITGI